MFFSLKKATQLRKIIESRTPEAIISRSTAHLFGSSNQLNALSGHLENKLITGLTTNVPLYRTPSTKSQIPKKENLIAFLAIEHGYVHVVLI